MTKLINFIKYRKYIKKLSNTYKYIKYSQTKLTLLCFSFGLNNISLLFLKLFYFEHITNMNLTYNIYHNMINTNCKYLYFVFLSFTELIHFTIFNKKLTIIPFLFFPVKIITNSKFVLPLYFCFINYKMKYLHNKIYELLINIITKKYINLIFYFRCLR